MLQYHTVKYTYPLSNSYTNLLARQSAGPLRTYRTRVIYSSISITKYLSKTIVLVSSSFVYCIQYRLSSTMTFLTHCGEIRRFHL